VKCSLLLLSSYVDGELEASRRGELEAHLVACQRCRVGLAHLREEVERIGSLARVRVPEASARALLLATGVIGAGDALPGQRTAPVETRPPLEVPPWLAAEAGAALPWTAARPPGRRGRGAEPGELAGAAVRIPDQGDVELPGSPIPSRPEVPDRRQSAFLADIAALRALTASPVEPAPEVRPAPPGVAATTAPAEEAPPTAGGEAPF